MIPQLHSVSLYESILASVGSVSGFILGFKHAWNRSLVVGFDGVVEVDDPVAELDDPVAVLDGPVAEMDDSVAGLGDSVAELGELVTEFVTEFGTLLEGFLAFMDIVLEERITKMRRIL